MKILGLDYGTKRIGIAMTDALGMMAFPHSIISQKDLFSGVDQVVEICTKENIQKIVIGKSFTNDGGENEAAKNAEHFSQLLSEKIICEIVFVDERYSSFEGARIHMDMGDRHGQRLSKKSRSQSYIKNTEKIDASAAVVILERYLSIKK